MLDPVHVFLDLHWKPPLVFTFIASCRFAYAIIFILYGFTLIYLVTLHSTKPAFKVKKIAMEYDVKKIDF